MNPINLNEKFSKFDQNWQPHQIASINDMQVIIAKLKGEFIWHSHDEEDEFFQVMKGTLYMEFKDKIEVINEGECIVVPKGIEHKPFTKNNEEVHVLLVEKQSTAHTGNTIHELTKTHYPKI